MVLEFFKTLKSCLVLQIFSKKVKYISVAQLVREISLKTFQIEFSNFRNFIEKFYRTFLLKDGVLKSWIQSFLAKPPNLKMTKSQKYLKIGPL